MQYIIQDYTKHSIHASPRNQLRYVYNNNVTSYLLSTTVIETANKQIHLDGSISIVKISVVNCHCSCLVNFACLLFGSTQHIPPHSMHLGQSFFTIWIKLACVSLISPLLKNYLLNPLHTFTPLSEHMRTISANCRSFRLLTLLHEHSDTAHHVSLFEYESERVRGAIT